MRNGIFINVVIVKYNELFSLNTSKKNELGGKQFFFVELLSNEVFTV